MGWSSGYHGYVFLDATDGAAIGPAKNDGYIDMMHSVGHFHHIMNDRHVPLALLLRKPQLKTCVLIYMT